MNSAENVSDERLAEMLQLAQHCRHGEFAALVEQRDIVRALAELQALRSPRPETVGVSAAMVERAAEVIWNDLFGARGGAWDNPPADSISGIQIRATAHAALTAARSPQEP